MTLITINPDSELYSAIKSRAKKNYQTPEELVEDIVRRSMLSYKKSSKIPSLKGDDPLINVFSRQKTGRKTKKKKK